LPRSINGSAFRARDQVRVDAHAKHPQPAIEVVLPQLLVPLRVAVSVEDVVDEDVQAALLPIDASDELGDLAGREVIDAQSFAFAARLSHEVARLFDRLGTLQLRRAGDSATAPGRVDVRAGPRELDGDRAACSAGRAGHQGYFAGECCQAGAFLQL
jgi:hypothetical protein